MMALLSPLPVTILNSTASSGGSKVRSRRPLSSSRNSVSSSPTYLPRCDAMRCDALHNILVLEKMVLVSRMLHKQCLDVGLQYSLGAGGH